jgi:hypothetical protein
LKEEVRRELIFNLRSLQPHKKTFEDDCAETEKYINSQTNSNLIHEDIRVKSYSYFNNNLCVKKINSHKEENIKNSDNQIMALRKLENLKKTNKLWYKLNEEEKVMLNKMSLNCYTEKLSYESVRKVVKKKSGREC